MEGRCQCGTITFTTPLSKPEAIYICYCIECQHQSASAFGISALFSDFDIPAPHKGAIGMWSRKAASGSTVNCYFCTTCGSRLLHRNSSGKSISVKGGCLEALDLSGAIHIWCKDAKVAIPDGVERYYMEPPGSSFDSP